MSMKDLDPYRKNNSDAWRNWPEAMERKTCVLRGKQFLPLSPDTDAQIGLIERSERMDTETSTLIEMDSDVEDVEVDLNDLESVKQITNNTTELSESVLKCIQDFAQLDRPLTQGQLESQLEKFASDWDETDLEKLGIVYDERKDV
jgi:recombinational DNA repair protein RecT